MTLLLDRSIRREVWIDQRPYTLVINNSGFVLSEKRRRSGLGVRWKDLVTGDAHIVVTQTARPAASAAASSASVAL